MNTNYFLTEGNRENEGYRFLAGNRILCFLRCLLFTFYRQSNSSHRSCAFVSISGLDIRKSRFKKDYKKLRSSNRDSNVLKQAIQTLAAGEELPASFRERGRTASFSTKPGYLKTADYADFVATALRAVCPLTFGGLKFRQSQWMMGT